MNFLPHLAAPRTWPGAHDRRQMTVIVAVTVLLVSSTATSRASAAQPPPNPALSIQITAPLGRTGLTGPMRIVARVVANSSEHLSPVQFFVDGTLIGEDADGAPYAVEWVDDNPFAPRTILVQVADSLGNTAKDTVQLEPLEVTQESSVLSVMLEAGVVNPAGLPANNLAAGDFHVWEDGVPQALDSVNRDTLPSTYLLLVDSSQSMGHRMEFVRAAAHQLPVFLRRQDRVVVAPFSTKVGAVTGPTLDRQTIAGAIDAIHAKGGTAILDCLADAAQQLRDTGGRRIIVLITDGYDENSTLKLDAALGAIKETHATVYVVAIGGIAGISLQGRDLLNRIAHDTGGKAFFPLREFQFEELSKLVAEDVQERYLIAYTPENQVMDGTWRSVSLTTTNPDHIVTVRPGYRAPAPPPIRPQIELTIRDTNRQFVDVAASDLEVVEDGVQQKIEVFEEAVAPVSIVLALDNSGSMRRDAESVVTAAKTFVDALPARDKLAVLHFADEAKFEQDLSTLRDWSQAAIDQYRAQGGTALYDALVLALGRLRTVEGRRVVVILTDGRDENNPGTAPGSTHSFDDVLELLRPSGATIFTIGMGSKVDREALERLAQSSGGESYFPEDVSSLPGEYKRILENLRRRYIIKYTSTNTKRDGGWRNVEVRSSRTGIVVDTQGGYFAPSGAPSAHGGDR